MTDLLINQKSQLEKLEHRIDAGLINAAKHLSNIIISLKEIEENKLYLLRNCRSIRNYILTMEYPKKLNLHISNIFLKMQIFDYTSRSLLSGYKLNNNNWLELSCPPEWDLMPLST